MGAAKRRTGTGTLPVPVLLSPCIFLAFPGLRSSRDWKLNLRYTIPQYQFGEGAGSFGVHAPTCGLGHDELGQMRAFGTGAREEQYILNSRPSL